jgi:sec-independent protein translocase protein TatC
MSEPQKGDMTILDHLEELRRRLIFILAALCVATIASYFFTDTLFAWIRWPLDAASPEHKITLNYMRLVESFNMRVKLAFVAGIFITIPITLFHLWRFISPGLHMHEKRRILPLVFWSTLLFFAGSALCYFWVMPITIRFLLEIAPVDITPVLTVSEYISFVMWTTISFGAVFELPLIALFLGKMGIINWRMLSKGRRYAIVGILFAAAVITPSTDALSMVLLALPLYMLYEVSIWLLRFRVANRPKDAR